jgi:hypothetical protein
MKTQREGHVLGKNFVYRFRWPNRHLADLPLLSGLDWGRAA